MSTVPGVKIIHSADEEGALNPPLAPTGLNELLGSPEVATSNQGFQEALAGDQPEIASPPLETVHLPSGVVLQSSTQVVRHFRWAAIRELNGYDEEALAAQDIDDIDAYITAILRRGVVGLGPIEPGDARMLLVEEDPGILWDLLVGDREFLVLEIRRATFGDDLPLTVSDNRPECGKTFEMVVELSTDIKVHQAPEEAGLFHLYSYQRGNKSHQIAYRLPTGSDRHALQAEKTQNAAELNTILLSRLINDIDSQQPVSLDDVRKLSVGVRRGLLLEIANKAPGPRFDQIMAPCPHCKKELGVSLTLANLF